jgi:hypothetical protein
VIAATEPGGRPLGDAAKRERLRQILAGMLAPPAGSGGGPAVVEIEQVGAGADAWAAGGGSYPRPACAHPSMAAQAAAEGGPARYWG